ncbi:MAG: hypothetical protein PVJ57_18230 [Phycisphaerae bacterium]
MVRSAIHVRTGEADTAEVVDAWLRQHQIVGVDFADAYEACVHLLEESERIPDVAFVGLDWLAPEELGIVRYIGETWPGTVLIVYRHNGNAPPYEGVVPVHFCRSTEALQQLLTDPPDRVLRRAREGFGPGPGRPSPVHAPSAPSPVKSMPLEDDLGPLEGDPTAEYLAPGAPPPRSFLTSEERSALLDDKDQ